MSLHHKRPNPPGISGADHAPDQPSEPPSLPSAGDDDVLNQCLAGDPAAREELFFRLNKMLHILVRQQAFANNLRKLRQDPRDIVQDILYMLLQDDCRRLRQFQRRASLRSWLKVIVTRKLLDLARSKAFRQALRTLSIHQPPSSDPDGAALLHTLEHPDANPREKAAYRELLELVREAAQTRLPKEDRLILRHWGLKLKEREIAAMMCLQEATVASRISRAKAVVLAYVAGKDATLIPKKRS